MTLEYRTLRAQPPGVRPVTSPADPTISGIAVVYDQLSDDLGGYCERIMPGAIALANDVWAFFSHDPSMVLGRVSAGTLRLQSLLDGLHFEAMVPDTQWARDLRTSMDRGDITQCSFGFVPTRDDWRVENGVPVHLITGAVLHEISVTTLPAYPQTSAVPTR